VTHFISSEGDCGRLFKNHPKLNRSPQACLHCKTFISQEPPTVTMTFSSKSQAALTNNAFTARHVGNTAAPQNTTEVYQPSLFSLFCHRTVEPNRASGFAYPLRDGLEKLGVQSGRTLVDIIDDALAVTAPARVPSFGQSFTDKEARQ
jgi:hypothetical protein